MWQNYKVKVHNVTEKQKEFLFRNIDIARYCYNWGLAYCNNEYKEGRPNPTKVDLTLAFTKYKNQKGNEWLKEVESSVSRFALFNVKTAFVKFFNKINRYPKFHSRKSSKKNFQVRGERIRFHGENNRYIHIPGAGTDPDMKFDLKNHNIPVGPNIKYSRVVISFDGDDFWISLSIEFRDAIKLFGYTEPIGIDVGIRTTATLSNGIVFEAPDQKRVKVLENRIHALAVATGRDRWGRIRESMRTKTKYEDIPKSKNQLKREKKIRKAVHDLTNLFDNHYHQVSRQIADMRPTTVVLEKLNIRKIYKDHFQAKNLTYRPISRLTDYIEYKCLANGAEVIRAPIGYPSSQICSRCGRRYKIGKEKTYSCKYCGFVIDRDLNASINLLNYGMKNRA